MSRLVLVSNRLPVTVKVDRGQVTVGRSSGGLATGLSKPHETSGGLWIGWPGDLSRVPPKLKQEVDLRLRALRCVPLHLSHGEVERYYESFANGILWPTFHYLLDRIPNDSRDWESYWKVNQKFADLVAVHHQKGDSIWVHDYQLMLLPGMLRSRLPDARIGFFLHIPFPSWEVFRILPWRQQIIEGLMGADLIGFHTSAYLRHFTVSMLRLTGSEPNVDRVLYKGREVRLTGLAMGIDAHAFDSTARDELVQQEAQVIRQQHGQSAIFLGIDRLDYTKGIPRRLLSFERLLENEPALRGRVKLIQLAVPSREKVPAYEVFRRQVEELVGRINGAYATPTWTPVHYLYRSLNHRQVCALYMAADVMLVTPLRDGMNLVAKEFAASRIRDDGVLILSELAGAAAEMGEALFVNPYDIEGTANAMRDALTMDKTEIQRRMTLLRARVGKMDVHAWVNTFLTELNTGGDVANRPRALEGDVMLDVLQRLRPAEHLHLIMEYDGALVPFSPHPEQAMPDAELMELLQALCSHPSISVHVVSGRDRQTLERWLGGLALSLYAENGWWQRQVGGTWQTAHEDSGGNDWKDHLRPILKDFTDRTPGSFVEEKSMAVAWHYQDAEQSFGMQQAQELRLHLGQLVREAEVEVQPLARVVEVRRLGMNKGALVPAALAARPGMVVAVGDDHSDEELYAAVPADGVSIHLGPLPTRAHYRMHNPTGLRQFLRALLLSS